MSHVVPTFLVAGAARSGTTGLVEGLRTHPGVFLTHPKEPHYFALRGQRIDFQGPGDAATINQVAVTDRARYLSLYPPDGSFVALGDGSVSTLYYHRESIPAIKELNPAMRIVILLREPVDRAYSSYQYMRARGFEPHERFLDAIADEDTRRDQNWHHLWHYRAMSHYADSVSAFLSAFGPDQVGLWYYDDFQRDYQGTVAQVLRFIGAPPVEGEGADVPRVNISGTPRSNALHHLIWASTRNETIRRNVKRLTSYRLRERVRRLALRPSGVDAETRSILGPEFENDLRRLADVVGDVERQPAWLAAHRATPSPDHPPAPPSPDTSPGPRGADEPADIAGRDA